VGGRGDKGVTGQLLAADAAGSRIVYRSNTTLSRTIDFA